MFKLKKIKELIDIDVISHVLTVILGLFLCFLLILYVYAIFSKAKLNDDALNKMSNDKVLIKLIKQNSGYNYGENGCARQQPLTAKCLAIKLRMNQLGFNDKGVLRDYLPILDFKISSNQQPSSETLNEAQNLIKLAESN